MNYQTQMPYSTNMMSMCNYPTNCTPNYPTTYNTTYQTGFPNTMNMMNFTTF